MRPKQNRRGGVRNELGIQRRQKQLCVFSYVHVCVCVSSGL